MTKRKPFDCVEFKNKAQERIQKELAGMTPEEELAYWAKQHEAFLEERRVIFERQKASAPIPAPLQTTNAAPLSNGIVSKMKKDFDCVEMKDKAQEIIQARTAGMTPEEELAYWAKGTAIMREEQKMAQEQRKAS